MFKILPVITRAVTWEIHGWFNIQISVNVIPVIFTKYLKLKFFVKKSLMRCYFTAIPFLTVFLKCKIKRISLRFFRFLSLNNGMTVCVHNLCRFWYIFLRITNRCFMEKLEMMLQTFFLFSGLMVKDIPS